MSPTELLAMLARAWSRLLLYPAGLSALATLWLLGRISGASYSFALRSERLTALLDMALPWLGLALLPLPLASELIRPVDIVVLISLLEWPRLRAAAREFRQGSVTRAAAMLNSYPPLILAVLLMAQARGTFEVQALLLAPMRNAALPVQASFWVGALALLLTMPALLGIGPFATAGHEDAQIGRVQRLGLGLRGLGIAGLGLCPWLSLIPEKSWWLLPVPVLLYCVVLWLFHRRTRGQAALPWARGLYWLSIMLLGTLLVLNAMLNYTF